MKEEDFRKLFYIKGNLNDCKKIIGKSTDDSSSLREINNQIDRLIKFIDTRINTEFKIEKMTTYEDFRVEELVAPIHNETYHQLQRELQEMIERNSDLASTLASTTFTINPITYENRMEIETDDLCDNEGYLLF